MAEVNINIIEKLSEKIHVLINMYEKIKKENVILTEEKKILEQEIANIKQKHTETEKKYETLKIAKNLIDTQGDASEVKVKLNTLVREIDKCISLLNQ